MFIYIMIRQQKNDNYTIIFLMVEGCIVIDYENQEARSNANINKKRSKNLSCYVRFDILLINELYSITILIFVKR